MTILLPLLLGLAVRGSKEFPLKIYGGFFRCMNYHIDSNWFDVMLRVYPERGLLAMAYTCDGKTFGTFEDTFMKDGDMLVLNSSTHRHSGKYQKFLDDFGERCPSLRKKPSWPDLAKFFPVIVPAFLPYGAMEFYVSGFKLALKRDPPRSTPS
ncbi:hypothetical protein FOL47_009252 [Perkinsus chesapeaki]|uniref:Uncharacterized protein n=1 Tax=Perkinsus chesapeaki TaxID=330153 RepID=A0A7J6L9U0_PERCH|nr:hypothetical protein FOL47_009252 [Perkinsus chesapeaki]